MHKHYECAEVYVFFVVLPSISRFAFEGLVATKIDREIECPVNLDLSDRSTGTQHENLQYELQSFIICHHGGLFCRNMSC